MILSAKNGVRGDLYDLDTGKSVPKPIWFDTESGLIEAYQCGEGGEILKDAQGNYQTYKASGRFRFIPRDRSARDLLSRLLGAPVCAKCSDPKTLPGEDLCVVCKAADRGQRNRMQVERLENVLLPHQCELCTRDAEWSVSDEVAVSPSFGSFHGRRAAFSRGAVVGRRFYCSFHYVPPRLLDARGEEIEKFETAGGVRPQ